MIRAMAIFLGEDGSLGYRKGHVYDLLIEGNNIVDPRPCPYESVEAFLNNWSAVSWTRIERGADVRRTSGGS